MARKMSVDDLYGGRSFPHGRVRDGSHHRIESEPSMRPGDQRPPPSPTQPRDPQVPQMPEDQHDNRGGHYDNQVSADSWLRGGGARGATGKPSFDRDNSWRRGRAGSLDWNSGSDPAVIRRPEPNKP